jgi:hypothetical protein
VRRRLALLLAAMVAAVPTAAGAAARVEGPSFDASTGFLYNSNLGNAQRAGDIEDDFFWNAGGGVTWSVPFARDWRASARLFAGTEIPFEYSAFTMARTGADLRLTRKFGLGARAPRAAAAVSFERDFFQDPQMSRWFLVPSARWTQPLGGAWSLEALYRFDARFADSALFSGQGNEGGLTLRWAPDGRWSFSGGYRVRYGDIVSFATPPRPDIVSVSSVVEPGNTIFGRPLTAYRLDALTQSFAAGAAFALTADISLELTGEFQHTSRSAISYHAVLVQLAAKASF